MDKWQALQAFWEQFGIPAYDEQTVPDDATMPYITYEARVDEFGYDIPMSASIWYRSKSWRDVSRKEKEIAAAITRGGTTVQYTGGLLWMQKGQPWAQRLEDPEDDSVRRIVLSIEAEFLE